MWKTKRPAAADWPKTSHDGDKRRGRAAFESEASGFEEPSIWRAGTTVAAALTTFAT
jgi:hypothetical protein